MRIHSTQPKQEFYFWHHNTEQKSNLHFTHQEQLIANFQLICITNTIEFHPYTISNFTASKQAIKISKQPPIIAGNIRIRTAQTLKANRHK